MFGFVPLGFFPIVFPPGNTGGDMKPSGAKKKEGSLSGNDPSFFFQIDSEPKSE